MRAVWDVEKNHMKKSLPGKRSKFCLGKIHMLQNLFMLVAEALMPKLALNNLFFLLVCLFLYLRGVGEHL